MLQYRLDEPDSNGPPATIQSIKILVVEDSAVLAERLAELIAEHPQFELIGVVDTEAGALRLINRQRVDMVLLDLRLRQGTGFGVLRNLAGTRRSPQVVVLTNQDLPEYYTAALKLGAFDFLDKARLFARLPDILREASHAFRVD
jgi:two-component system OmpR family response regulator